MLLSSTFSIALTLAAFFLGPFTIGIEKRWPNRETTRKKYRQKWYPTIQATLSSVSDQQFVSALAVLSAALGNFNNMTIYHRTLAYYFAFLCQGCFTANMEFEDAPLNDNEPTEFEGWRHEWADYDFDWKSKDQNKLNAMRISLVVLFLSVLTVFSVKMAGICTVWDENDPGYCYQSVLSISFWDCRAQNILWIVWMWVEFSITLFIRAEVLHRCFCAFEDAVDRGIRKLRLDSIIVRVKVWIIRFKINKLWNSKLILTIARASWSCLPNLYLVFRLVDMKLSNIKLLADGDENQWTFGQIMPMIMLLTVPLAIAKVAWGQRQYVYNPLHAMKSR
jgi:hypothetical protein